METFRFDYNPGSREIVAHILTISNASTNWVYPLISLGVIVNNTILTPIDIPKWALESQGEYHSVNIDACVWEEGNGYICSTNVYQGPHICLNASQGKCHYDLEPHIVKPVPGSHCK